MRLINNLKTSVLCATVMGLSAMSAHADISGLNLIPTPEIIAPDSVIGHVYYDTTIHNHVKNTVDSVQVGLNSHVEGVFTHNVNPSENGYGFEVGGWSVKNVNVAGGFVGQNVRGKFNPVYFGVASVHLTPTLEVVAGSNVQDSSVQGFGGAALRLGNLFAVKADYTGGRVGASSVGLDYTVNKHVSVTPVVVIPNNNAKSLTSYVDVSLSL